MAEFIKFFAPYITPTSTVLVAFITTCGALIVKRYFSLSDRRTRRDELCDRYENAYGILAFWSRQFKQSVVSIDSLRNDPTHGDEYALMRLRELATEPTPLEQLDRYIQGVEDLPDGD